MKSVYLRTNWIDNKTPVNAANLNNIERGIDTLFKSSVSPSELIEGDGIVIEQGDDGSVFSVDGTVPRSVSVRGIEYVFGELASYQADYIYYVLNPENWKLEKIVINNRVVYEVE